MCHPNGVEISTLTITLECIYIVLSIVDRVHYIIANFYSLLTLLKEFFRFVITRFVIMLFASCNIYVSTLFHKQKIR